MSNQWRFRIVGLFILVAFPLFGGGQALLGGRLDSLGILMCFANSAAVISIGFLMRPVIATTAPRSGDIYRIARITEGVFLALSVVVVQGQVLGLTIPGASFYQLAMIGLGLGSLPMCLWLIKSKFVPTILGMLGFVGYLCLVAGMIASALGSETVAMALLLPGAAFEVVFGVTLVLERWKLQTV
jgi:hypothetical protein